MSLTHVMRPLFYTTSDRSNATAKFQAKKQLSPISKIFNIVHNLVNFMSRPIQRAGVGNQLSWATYCKIMQFFIQKI